MEKQTDIEDLARMVANGFSAMDKRFDKLESRMDRADERMDGFETRLESFEDSVNSRFDRIENVVLETNRSIDRVIMPTQEEHARRIKNLELKIA
jgi:DNA anti-recombination protein RmuC